MTFQSTVNKTLAFGIPGEFYADGPTRVTVGRLNSGDAKNNVFGRAFTWDGDDAAGAGGTGSFAGIMVNPKAYPLFGNSTNPLAPSLALPNGLDVEFCTMGILIVTFSASASIGQKVVYDTATGVLSTVNATVTDAGTGRAFVPNAFVSHFLTAGAGPAVITLTN